MRKFLLFSLVCSTLALTGCSVSQYSQVVTDPIPAVIQTQNTQAAVVFVRDELDGSAVSAPIACYKEELNDYRFLGVLNAFETSLVMLEPGQYVFVVGGESQSAAKGDLEGGKLYALRPSSRFGILKSRFAFEKMAIDDKFAKKAKTYPRIEPSAKGFTDMAPSMEKKVNVIKRKGAPTDFLLTPEDGMPFEEFKVLFDKAPIK